jgi:hypothetical protein
LIMEVEFIDKPLIIIGELVMLVCGVAAIIR